MKTVETNTDLIMELCVLNEFRVLSEEKEVDKNKFNHALLDEAVEDFEKEILYAIHRFHDAIYNRMNEIYKELNERGVTDVELM